ncbi:MAG TPA: thiamine pyrophosphate-dependent dehydrogenase E1 component subunit alpha, partial [Candidatus Caldiarchaeum subterraneum]|nr:thiamine pyrophosphate-dependent dehydrogenase E1 component subunit alpha [Candidatus Caldarchaeum subterraneum]
MLINTDVVTWINPIYAVATQKYCWDMERIGEVSVSEYEKLGMDADRLLRMLKKMILIRRFEERVERLFFEGKLIGPSHLYLGQEAIAVGVAEALDEEDLMVSTYRGHGHALARGVPAKAVMAELFGKATGTCKGLGGSMHAAISRSHNIPVATAIVGSGIPIAAGMALALKQLKQNRVVAVFFGDGAANTGAFGEGLNLTAIWKLPAIFICENNQYAEFTSLKRTFAGDSIARRAEGYGIKALQVDGNDVAAVFKAVKEAAETARKNKEPMFIECITYRMKGHGVYDTAWYRPKEEVEAWLRRDPIQGLILKMRSKGIIDDSRLSEIEDSVRMEIDDAV